MLQHILTRFSPTLIISTLLLATFMAQQHANPLIFLPSGIQLVAGFVYGLRALPGCIIGMSLGAALLAQHPITEDTLILQGAYSTLSTLSLLGLIHAVCTTSRINDELASLGYRHILIVLVLQALADALLRTALIPTTERSASLPFLALATGSLLGSMAVVLTLFALSTLHRKLTSATLDAS